MEKLTTIKGEEFILSAMNCQGQRTDLTFVPLGQKLGKTSRELLAEKLPDSNTQIQRYIRLVE